MIYGYARCSTNEQLQDINRQVRELKQQGATDTTIYMEYESGTKMNRAELQKLLHVVSREAPFLLPKSAELPEAQNNFAILLNLRRNSELNWCWGILLWTVQRNSTQ